MSIRSHMSRLIGGIEEGFGGTFHISQVMTSVIVEKLI